MSVPVQNGRERHVRTELLNFLQGGTVLTSYAVGELPFAFANIKGRTVIVQVKLVAVRVMLRDEIEQPARHGVTGNNFFAYLIRGITFGFPIAQR